MPKPTFNTIARNLRRGLLVAACLHFVSGCAEPWKAPFESRSAANYRGVGIGGTTYRVRPGDTLYGIAWRAGADYKDLAAWNNIRAPYTIFVGQELRLAASSPTAAHQSATSKAVPTQAVIKEEAAAMPEAAKANADKKSVAALPTTAEPPGASGTLRWRWPTEGRLSGTYSPHDPARKGIKIAGVRGQVVRAAEGGEVVYSGSGLVGYGELIILKHSNDYLSAYGHNNKRLVKEGERVMRGATIAEMGLAGGEPRLHFEIRRRGKPVDPLALLPRR